MANGKFKPKRTKMGKSGWHISRVDGRSKIGKELTARAKRKTGWVKMNEIFGK